MGCDQPGRRGCLRQVISIHAPRVGCDPVQRGPDPGGPEISIHAPRVGCDNTEANKEWNEAVFQSTHPVWGATTVEARYRIQGEISIHAPRVGCDPSPSWTRLRPLNFNPRTPCGVRRFGVFSIYEILPISIHAPRVGCDPAGPVHSVPTHISIHAPRVGCDRLNRLPGPWL